MVIWATVDDAGKSLFVGRKPTFDVPGNLWSEGNNSTMLLDVDIDKDITGMNTAFRGLVPGPKGIRRFVAHPAQVRR